MEPRADKRTTAARAFVRSLNILLKFARMYDFGHPRTAKQYETAWTELRTALGDNDAGLLLSVSADQLLLDGTPLEAAAAEKSFARMLSSAGIASIHFSPRVTQTSLAKFVRGFPTGSGAKPGQLAEQLKAALQGDPNIHVNEVCFVPADSAVAKTTVAAQIAARTMGLSSEQQDEMFKDPEKLLQLIVAAEGMKGSGGGPGGGPGGSGGRGGRGGGGGEHRGGTSGSGGGSEGTGSGEGYGPGREGSGEDHYGGYRWGDSRSFGRWIPGRSGLRAPSGSNAPQGGGTFEGPVAAVESGSAGQNADGALQDSEKGQGAGSSSGSGRSGGWNIIGAGDESAEGGRERTSLDPNAAGFWFNSSGGNPSHGTENVDGSTPENVSFEGPISGIGAAGANPSTRSSSQFVPGGGAASGSRRRNVRGSNFPFSSLAAAESAAPGRWSNASAGIRGPRTARPAPGTMAVETGLMTLQEEELQGILQVLAQMARTSGEEKLDPSAFQSRLSSLPRRARFTVSQALSALAAQAPAESANKPTLLKLAEHIAIRFALENYERGDLKVNAVRQILDEMNQELGALRKVLGVYEEEMARAGIAVPSQTDLFAQQFWSQVPEEKMKSVLESDDAWCVPATKTAEYVKRLRDKGENDAAEKILRNYAGCITSKSAEARRQASLGLAELAPLYAADDERLLVDTIRQAGVQLSEETDSELQSLVGAAFVRLSQVAAKKRSYSAIQRSVELVDYIEGERPSVGKSLRPRIAVENRLPEFIEDALRSGEVPGGLKDLLRRLPKAASEQVAARFTRAGFREDCELLISMMGALGPEALDHLRKVLRDGGPTEAIDTIGILTRMDIDAVQDLLPGRIKEWKRTAHDRVVRQIAASGSPQRGQLLLKLFDHLDSLIRPLAVDEIGMSGEQTADMRFLRIAEGDVAKDVGEYLRLKAIEALGRLRTMAAETALRRIAEARKAFRWANASELRLVAAQAMEKIDADWVRNFVPRSGLSTADFSIVPLDPDPNSSAIRQRRYPRLRLEHPVPASTTNLKENCNVEIPEMTLGGGVALCEQSLHPGSVVGLRINAGQKTIKAQTIVRDANTQARAFEVVDIDLEERAKLRKILVQLGNALKQATPNERNRRSTRTILSNPTSSEK